jgi:hypothetical protein
VDLQEVLVAQAHPDLLEVQEHLAQAVHQALQDQAVAQDLLDLLVHQVHRVHQDHQELPAQTGFLPDKFIILMNQFQAELVHIKNYQLIQPVQLNNLFLKQQQVVHQS